MIPLVKEEPLPIALQGGTATGIELYRSSMELRNTLCKLSLFTRVRSTYLVAGQTSSAHRCLHTVLRTELDRGEKAGDECLCSTEGMSHEECSLDYFETAESRSQGIEMDLYLEVSHSRKPLSDIRILAWRPPELRR
jgi:hypothetical protein